MAATRLRLASVRTLDTLCRLVNKSTGELCGWTPHAWYCHPFPCLSVLPSTSEGTHSDEAHVRWRTEDVYISRLMLSELYRSFPSPESDAIMDLVTFSPDNFSRFLVDVRVRTPLGETVLALPVETHGRLRDEAESTLWTLAQAAERAGGNGTAIRIHRSWKTELQRVVLRAVADVALLAMYGCPPEGGSAEWG